MVYEAVDRESGSHVALKTLRSLSGETLLQLKSEFRTLQDIEHPNLIRLDELTRDGDTWFFTMELIHGATFVVYVTGAPSVGAVSSMRSDASTGEHAAIQPNLGFDEQRLRDSLIQLAQGLSALHAAGKVHRDIKPDNVLVTFDGRVVILDLGLAREPTAAGDDEIVGTVLYMAPEQISGGGVGPPCDWYAVGVMLYVCLTGRHPFEGSSIDVMNRKLEAEPPAPSAVSAGVPADLEALCVDLLRREPTERPTGAEFLTRLRRGSGSDRSARRGPGAGRVRRPIERAHRPVPRACGGPDRARGRGAGRGGVGRRQERARRAVHAPAADVFLEGRGVGRALSRARGGTLQSARRDHRRAQPAPRKAARRRGARAAPGGARAALASLPRPRARRGGGGGKSGGARGGSVQGLWE